MSLQLPHMVDDKSEDGDYMFRNLRAEMAREGFDGKKIASGIGISNKSFSNKILGKSEFTRTEMIKIHRQFFPKCSIGYLFEMSELVSA